MSLKTDYEKARDDVKNIEAQPWFADYKKLCKKRDALKKAYYEEQYGVIGEDFIKKALPLIEDLLKKAKITMPVSKDVGISEFGDHYGFGNYKEVGEAALKPLGELINDYSEFSKYDPDPLYAGNIVIDINPSGWIKVGEQGDYDETCICDEMFSLLYDKGKVVEYEFHDRSRYLSKINQYNT